MDNSAFDLAFAPIVLVIWLAGIAYRGFGGSIVDVITVGVGAVLSIILVAVPISRNTRRRAADEQRLAAESED